VLPSGWENAEDRAMSATAIDGATAQLLKPILFPSIHNAVFVHVLRYRSGARFHPIKGMRP